VHPKEAFEQWLESVEGKRCADFGTLVPGPYLENRLWLAFMSGYNDGEHAESERLASLNGASHE
jgi:hypothetical protein